MNRRKGLVRRLVALSASLALAVSAAGCGAGGSNGQQTNGTIAVIGQAQGVQFWELMREGAAEACEEMGYTLDYSCASKASDVSGQIQLVEEAINKGVDGIVLAPNSPTDMNTVLQKAENAKIPVITVSSPVNYPGVKSYIGSDNASAGAIAGRKAISELGTSGNIGIIGHSSSATNALERVQGFISVITNANAAASTTDATGGTTDTDGNNVVISKYVMQQTTFSDGSRDGTKNTAMDYIKAHPDVNLIFATNENSTLGVCDAVVAMDKVGVIKVIGFNASDDEISYVNNGTLTATVVQSPYNMGYLGVRYIDALKNKETLRSKYDTGAMVIDKSNVNDELSQLWVNPAQH